MPRKPPPTKGWGKQKPRRKAERAAVYRRCSKKCFLIPSQKKFPICAKGGRGCRPSCKGLLAAIQRANANCTKYGKHCGIATKARRIARRRRCGWVRK